MRFARFVRVVRPNLTNLPYEPRAQPEPLEQNLTNPSNLTNPPNLSNPVRSEGVLSLVETPELLLQRGDLRRIVDDDVRLVRMLIEVVLVILLGGVEAVEGRHLRRDR